MGSKRRSIKKERAKPWPQSVLKSWREGRNLGRLAHDRETTRRWLLTIESREDAALSFAETAMQLAELVKDAVQELECGAPLTESLQRAADELEEERRDLIDVIEGDGGGREVR